jgi:hypothetical protein
MSAPSFSSFPPSFSSFPDADEPKSKKKEKPKEKSSSKQSSKEEDRDGRERKSRHEEREWSSRHGERERSRHHDEKDRDKSSKSGRTKEQREAEKAYREEKRRARKGKDREREKRKEKKERSVADAGDVSSDLDEPTGDNYNFERDLEDARKQQRAVNEADHSTLDLSNLCTTDRKGDAGNIQYGSLHRADVPRFFRAGCECSLQWWRE